MIHKATAALLVAATPTLAAKQYRAPAPALPCPLPTQ